MILSRSGQGIGGAIVFATSLALLGHSFRGKDRGIAFGIWGAVSGVATAAGPVLGGLITTGWDWRGIFLVNIPIGIFALAVTIWRVEETRAPQPTRPDWTGFGLLTTGLVSLIYGLIRASETSWTDTGVLACLAVGVVLLAAFVVAETRVANPMFTCPAAAGPDVRGRLHLGVRDERVTVRGAAVPGDLPAGHPRRTRPSAAGLRVSSSRWPRSSPRPWPGGLSEHMPVRWLIGPGLLLVGIGLLVMAGLTGTSSWTHLVPGFIIAGLGSGLVNPPLASTAIGVVPPHQAGMASGVNSTFRQIGIAAGIAALGSIFVSAMQSHLVSTLPPSLKGSAGTIAAAVRQGSVGHVLGVHARR